MNRRSFFSRLGQAVAGAVLAAHVDFGSLLPVQEVVQMKYRQLGLSTMYTTFLLPDESIRYGMSPLEKAWEAIIRTNHSKKQRWPFGWKWGKDK